MINASKKCLIFGWWKPLQQERNPIVKQTFVGKSSTRLEALIGQFSHHPINFNFSKERKNDFQALASSCGSTGQSKPDKYS